MTDTSVPPDPELDDTLTSFLGELPIADFAGAEYEDDNLPPVKDEKDITSGFEDSTVQVGDGACDVCGAAVFRPPGLTKSGRKKRVPKYCDLHTPNARVSSVRSDVKGMESQLQRIQEELADDVRLLGALAGPLFPVTGYYVFAHADPFVIAILKLAKNNNAVLRVLHRAAQIAPIYTVAETVAGTAYAIQVDTQKADPYSSIGQRLGVARAYDAIYPTNGNGTKGDTNNLTNSQQFSAPPHYAGTQ